MEPGMLEVVVEHGLTTGTYVDQLVDYLREFEGADPLTRDRAADTWVKKAQKAGMSPKKAEKLVELARLVLTEDSRH